MCYCCCCCFSFLKLVENVSIDSDGNSIKTYNGTISNLIDPIILQEDIDDEQTSFLVSDTFDCLIGAKFTDGIENFIVKDKVKGD